jgi:hypothetical protein
MIFIGIDGGKAGALCAMDGDGTITEVITFPVIGKDYDRPGLLDWLRKFDPHETHVCYEALHTMPGRMGAQANFQRGYCMGMIETALTALRLPHTPVRAKKWQKTMFAGRKCGKGETKSVALQVAQSLWPDRDWRATERSRVPHDGIVDSCLIAEFARRELA